MSDEPLLRDISVTLAAGTAVVTFGTASRSLSAGTNTTRTPAERAAPSFSSRPPMGSMLPPVVITPVAATSTPPVTSPGSSTSR